MMEVVLMADTGFVLHGAIVTSVDKHTIRQYPDAYLVCINGICEGVFEELPLEYSNLPMEDYWENLIIPGFVDLHTHAPQFTFRGLGTDMELLEWLEIMAFPEEAKYADRTYSVRAYDLFVESLYESATTRAVIFGTIDYAATVRLMDQLEDSGMVTCVGKVNMDRNAPDYYIESTEESLANTRHWLKRVRRRNYRNTYAIITPRFTPSCSKELMQGLGEIRKEFHLPVQSHLSENINEIKWVAELEPESAFYGETYSRYGLFGGDAKTIMAHCVYSTPEEVDLMAKNGVFIAHCPQSNMNLSSGVAPVRTYLDKNMKVGLGSDVAGGSDLSIFTAMKDAVNASKLRFRLYDQSLKPLKLSEVFYMATKGGGEFFGKVGSFEKGYEFDAVVIDDSNLPTMKELSPEERLERLMYFSDERNVIGKYVRGEKLY